MKTILRKENCVDALEEILPWRKEINSYVTANLHL